LRASFGKAGIAVEHHHWAYQQIMDNVAPMAELAPEMLKRVIRLGNALAQHPELTAELGIEAGDLSWAETAVADGARLTRLTDLAAEYRLMKGLFVGLPEFDYVGEKSRLEVSTPNDWLTG
jgi:hypothetical protein